jgi:hypothetical protein
MRAIQALRHRPRVQDGFLDISGSSGAAGKGDEPDDRGMGRSRPARGEKQPYMNPVVVVVLASLLAASAGHLEGRPQTTSDESLAETIASLDSQVFDAFNRCADPAQLEAHAAFFAEDVEFYHDTGGVTWNRAEMLANTKQYACGHYTRELVRGSVSVYPVKDFGAIEQGRHRFCQVGSGTCEGQAEFVMVWRRTDAGWKITRVLSYGHRPA